MTIIVIPTPTGFFRAAPDFLDNGVDQTPPMGGVSQRLNRLGSRWALTVSLPPMREGPDFLAMEAAIIPGRSAGVSYPWPQPGVAVRQPGTPVIAGAGQTGSVLLLAGFVPQFTMRRGQALSVTDGRRRYLYKAAAATDADGSGAMTLPIYPMLRASPTNASAVETVRPMIEGKLAGDNFSWDHAIHPYIPLQFRIEEIA